MGKTYLVGKIGKSIKFNPSTWSGLGGDVELPSLLLGIAKQNPEDNFIIIGRNDIGKLNNAPKNLIDCATLYNQMKGTTGMKMPVTYIWDTLKDIKIDGCFLAGGPTGSTNLIDKALKRNPLKEGIHEFAKTLEMHMNYSGPIYHFLNESQIPWVMLAQDPRYMKMGRDCLNLPKKILSQYDEDILIKTLKSFEDQEELQETTIKATYAEMEKMYLIGRNIERDATKFDKTKKLLVVLNEGNNGVKSRYPAVKEFILNHIDDVEIYGKWDPETIKDDTRFKGTVPFMDLQEMLPSVKYTFIIPIKEGWVTMKVWEMIANGIIPFFHPDYDKQKHLKVPDFLRVKNSKELHERIEQLEANPDKRIKLVNLLLSLITEDDISGKNLSNIIFNEVNKYEIDNTNKIEFVAPEPDDEIDDEEW